MSLSERFRSVALACEKKAKSTPDVATKEAWVEMAIEWHSLAAKTAVAIDDIEIN